MSIFFSSSLSPFFCPTLSLLLLSQGYFLRPTIITDVSDSSRLMKEEVFGPVTCVVPFKTEEEVAQHIDMYDEKA